MQVLKTVQHILSLERHIYINLHNKENFESESTMDSNNDVSEKKRSFSQYLNGNNPSATQDIPSTSHCCYNNNSGNTNGNGYANDDRFQRVSEDGEAGDEDDDKYESQEDYSSSDEDDDKEEEYKIKWARAYIYLYRNGWQDILLEWMKNSKEEYAITRDTYIYIQIIIILFYLIESMLLLFMI